MKGDLTVSEQTEPTQTKPVIEVDYRIKVPAGVLGCDATPDGQTLYAACIDGGIYRVDVASKKHEKIGQHESYASALVTLPQSSRVVSGGYDGYLRWFDQITGEEIRAIKAHDFWSWNMSASPDERYIASVTGQYMVGGYDYKPAPETEPSVKLFDADSGKLVREWSHLPPVQSVAFDPSSRYLAAGNRLGDVHIWDVENGKQVASFNTPDFTTWGIKKSHFFAGGITASAFTLDGKDLLLAGQGEMTKPIASNGQQLWQRFAWTEKPARKADEVHEGQSGLGLMETLAVHPSGSCFLMAGRLNSGDWNAALFDRNTGGILHSISTKTRIADSVFSSDGSTLFLAGMTGQGKGNKLSNDYGTIDVCKVVV